MCGPSPPLIHSNHEIIVLAEKGRDGDISISLLRSVQVGLPPPQTMDGMIFSPPPPPIWQSDVSERVDLSSPPTPNNIVHLKTSLDSAHQRKKIHKPPFCCRQKSMVLLRRSCFCRLYVVYGSKHACSVREMPRRIAYDVYALTHIRHICAHGHDGTHDVLPRNGAKGEGGIISK